MRLTKRGEYGLRALIDLGLARETGRPMLQIGELARKENIPIKFLEQILVELKEHGYLESKRGKNGGYFLKKPMDTIRIGDVVRRMEGRLSVSSEEGKGSTFAVDLPVAPAAGKEAAAVAQPVAR